MPDPFHCSTAKPKECCKISVDSEFPLSGIFPDVSHEFCEGNISLYFYSRVLLSGTALFGSWVGGGLLSVSCRIQESLQYRDYEVTCADTQYGYGKI